MYNEWINKGINMVDKGKAHYYAAALYYMLGLVGTILIFTSMIIGWNSTSTFRIAVMTLGCFIIAQNESIAYRLDERWM